MILTLARYVIAVAYPVTLVCMLLTTLKVFQLLNLAMDIANKSIPKKVSSRRAKRIFKSLKSIVVVMLLMGCVTLAAAIDLRSAGEEVELFNASHLIYYHSGGLGYGYI